MGYAGYAPGHSIVELSDVRLFSSIDFLLLSFARLFASCLHFLFI